MEVEQLATLERLRQSQRQDHLKVFFQLSKDGYVFDTVMNFNDFSFRDRCPARFKQQIV